MRKSLPIKYKSEISSNTISGFDMLFKRAAGGDADAIWQLTQHPIYKRIVKTGLDRLGLKGDDRDDLSSEFNLHLFRALPRVGVIKYPRRYLQVAFRRLYFSQRRKPDAKNISLDDGEVEKIGQLGRLDEALVDTPSWKAVRMETTTPVPLSELPRGRKSRRFRKGSGLSSLTREELQAKYKELPEKTRSGIENATRFIRVLNRFRAQVSKNESYKKSARFIEFCTNSQIRLLKIWGRDLLDAHREYLKLKAIEKEMGKVGKELAGDERKRISALVHDYPAVILFHEICEEESSLRARLPLGQWRTWLHLIFDNIFDEPPLFIKLKLTPERLLFDVLAKSPEMKRGRYLNLYKIGLAMAACGFGDTVPNVENLRQYRYRATSQPRLYKRIVNKIYKRSFFNQINIENPHDSDYWLDKEMQAHLKKQQGRGIKDEYGTRQFRAIERIRKLERRSKLRSVHQTPLDSESPD